MNAKQENLLLAAVSLFFVLLSLGSLGWAGASGLIRDIDGLLLALVCLVSALIFGVQFYLLVKKVSVKAGSSTKDQVSTGAGSKESS